MSATILFWCMLILSIAQLASPASLNGQRPVLESNPHTFTDRAIKLLEKHPLIDGHNDLAIRLRFQFQNHINGGNFRRLFEEGGLPGEVDIPRIKAGRLGGAFWSCFCPCPRNVSDFSDANYYPYVKATLEQLDVVHRLGLRYPDLFTPVLRASDALDAFKSHRLISPLGIEGLHQIGNSLSTLRLYHQLGVKYATLTWNCHNMYADSALTTEGNETRVAEPLWHGVSKAGVELIDEMNRMGMIVDLSHTSEETMRDVLVGSSSKGWKGSLAPPIFSHSSAYSLCPHPRNVPDHILELVRQRNSVVMINVSPGFISCVASDDSSGLPRYFPPNNTLTQVIRHVRYIGELIGWDHVGIGTDFDGIESTPKGFEDVSKFPQLVAALLENGVSEQDVVKVIGGNILRVWHDVDRTATKLQKERLPAEDRL